MRKSKGVSLEHYHSRNGFLFVLPWAIGFLLFFLIPILQSILFSFCDVNVGTSGFKLSFIGLKNFYYAFLNRRNMLIIWLIHYVPLHIRYLL